MVCFRLGRQRYMIQNCTIYKRIQKGLSRHWRCSFPSPCSHFPSLTLPSSPLPPISLVTKLLIILMEMSNLLVVSIYTPEHHPLSLFCLQWKFSICFCLTSFCCVGIWSIVVRNLFLVKDLPRSRTASIAPASFCFWALPSRPLEVSPRVRIFQFF